MASLSPPCSGLQTPTVCRQVVQSFLHRALHAQWFSSGAGPGPREEKSMTSGTIRVLRSNVRIIEKVKQGQNMPHLANGESLSHRIEHLRGRDTEHISI